MAASFFQRHTLQNTCLARILQTQPFLCKNVNLQGKEELKSTMHLAIPNAPKHHPARWESYAGCRNHCYHQIKAGRRQSVGQTKTVNTHIVRLQLNIKFSLEKCKHSKTSQWASQTNKGISENTILKFGFLLRPRQEK